MRDTLFQKLESNLEEMVKIYRLMLDLLRREKELMMQADRGGLEESNKTKEAFLIKLKGLEVIRMRAARELAVELQADPENPRLLELAQKLGGEPGDRLRNFHSTLALLIKRVTEHNQENEVLAQGALKNLDGALNQIKDALTGKPTYERKGKVSRGPDKAGNLVRRQV
jgi:flagellar biosynthesis/type III secretory pathway chaperone